MKREIGDHLFPVVAQKKAPAFPFSLHSAEQSTVPGFKQWSKRLLLRYAEAIEILGQQTLSVGNRQSNEQKRFSRGRLRFKGK